MNFQVGDKVTAFGCKGFVKKLSDNGMFVLVKFPECESLMIFNNDGKLMEWHKKPSLKLVRSAQNIVPPSGG